MLWEVQMKQRNIQWFPAFSQRVSLALASAVFVSLFGTICVFFFVPYFQVRHPRLTTISRDEWSATLCRDDVRECALFFVTYLHHT